MKIFRSNNLMGTAKACSGWNILSVLSLFNGDRKGKNGESYSTIRRNRTRQLALETLEDRRLLTAVPGNAGLDLPVSAGTEIVVTTVIDDPADEEISLQEAIAQAEAGDTITFADKLSGKTITLTEELTIDKAITIDASDLNGGITIDADKNCRVFSISGGTMENQVQLINLTITGGKSDSYEYGGGGIYNTGKLTLTSCTVSNCFASYGGGGIYNDTQGFLTICGDTRIVENEANLYGGGIYNTGTFTGIDSVISKNKATEDEYGVPGSGGGVYNIKTVEMTGCNISENSAGMGGGIYSTSTSLTVSELTLSNSLICKNTVSMTFDPEWGIEGDFSIAGGIYQAGGTAAITNCTIAENITASTVEMTGGIYSVFYQEFDDDGNITKTETAVLNIYNSIIVKNSNKDIDIAESDVTLTGNNNLTSYTAWDTKTSKNNLVYDSSKTLFTAAEDDYYSLVEDSQAVNKGDNSFAKEQKLTVDYAGNDRFSNAIVDIGAYEYQFTRIILEEITLSDSAETPVYSATGESTTVSVILPEGILEEEITYQWYRVREDVSDPEMIMGAVGKTYTVCDYDVNTCIKVSATQQNGDEPITVWAQTEKVLPAEPVVSDLISSSNFVQENCAIGFNMSLAYSNYYDMDQTEFHWKAQDQEYIVIGKTDFWFTAENLKLNAGENDVEIKMWVVDEYNHKSNELTKTVNVISDPAPTLSFQTSKFDNGQILKLAMDLQSTQMMNVAQWVVNWGDDTEQTFDLASEALTAAHYYAESNEVKNYQVSVTVKNSSKDEIYSNTLFTYKVDAAPLVSGVIDESVNTAEAALAIFDPAAGKTENQEFFFVPAKAVAAIEAESAQSQKAVLFAAENPNEDESDWDFLNDETLSSYAGDGEELPLLEEDEIAVLL